MLKEPIPEVAGTAYCEHPQKWRRLAIVVGIYLAFTFAIGQLFLMDAYSSEVYALLSMVAMLAVGLRMIFGSRRHCTLRFAEPLQVYWHDTGETALASRREWF